MYLLVRPARWQSGRARRAISHTLGVTAVLEGSVRRDGDRLRVTAQLIDATNGYHPWSRHYDRDLQDVFAVQDDIARAIAGALERGYEERNPGFLYLQSDFAFASVRSTPRFLRILREMRFPNRRLNASARRRRARQDMRVAQPGPGAP